MSAEAAEGPDPGDATGEAAPEAPAEDGREDPARFAETVAASLTKDLGALLDREVACAAEPGAPAPRDALLADGAERHHAALAAAGGDALAHWLVTDDAARALAALQLGEAPSGAFDAAARSALDEILELATSSVARALESRLDEKPTLAAPSAALVEDATLPDGRLLPFEIRIEGAELTLAVLEEPAVRWFAIERGEDLPLAVVDPDPASRTAVEALAGELGRPVWTLDPADLGDATFEELGESGAIVVAWDLGARCGLDLVEALARDPRTRALPLAVASATPTRERVLAALRSGAWTFLQQPWQSAEIEARLRAARREAPPDA